MRLLYTSDLHGGDGHYAKLLTVAEHAKPDLVVLGGDLLPDDTAMNPKSLGHGQPAYVRGQFRRHITDLRQRCRCRDVLVIFGNHDWGGSLTAMRELAQEHLVTILDHKHCVEVDGLSFIGYSYTPPTPWFVKDFERLDRSGDRPPLLGGARWNAQFSRSIQHSGKQLFDGLPSIIEDLESIKVPADPWIFVAHAPPHGTCLDQSFGKESFGSRSIREAIEKHQPLLSLHGHIHESPMVTGSWRESLGSTISVNPGQTVRNLNFVTIDIDVPSNKVSHIVHGRLP
ncbi:MAG: metallophosphoesterase [Phycisphaerae bacterium]